jgi:hypothetical protein
MAWACGVSLVLAACGGKSEHAPTFDGASGSAGSSGTSASAPEPVPPGELCSRYVSALCQHLVACGLEGFADVAACTRQTDCAGVAQVNDDVSVLGTLAYDATATGACLDSFIRSACPASGTPDPQFDAYRLLASCPGAITALSGSGQVCTGNAECASGLFCKKGADPSCQGACGPSAVLGENCRDVPCADGLACDFTATCVPAQRVGDACTIACSDMPGGRTCPSDQICPGDLWCDPASAQCAYGRALGEPCGVSVPCALNLWCSRALGAASGACALPGAAGAPCDDSPIACEPGLHCAGYVPSVAPNGMLGACAGISGAGSSCTADADCLGGLLCIHARCSRRIALGGDCFRDVDCVTGLVCQAEHCATPVLPGAPCALGGTPCHLSRCVARICQAYAKFGEPCAADDDCASVRCVQGTCFDPSACSEP